MKSIQIAAAVALMTASFAASATVTFNAESGTGFIGRGDVITFVGKGGLVTNPVVTYQDQVTYSQTCEKTTENNGKQSTVVTHTRTRERNVTVNAQVGVDVRQARGNDNISGYMLTGYVGGMSLADAPTDLCADPKANPDNSGWVGTSPVMSSGSTGGMLKFNNIVIPF